eukprot:2380022-Lingulodinium_polyedra.AAC.1
MTDARRYAASAISQFRNHADFEPVACLRAWRDVARPPTKSHCRCNPSAVEVEMHMAAHMEASDALGVQFRV